MVQEADLAVWTWLSRTFGEAGLLHGETIDAAADTINESCLNLNSIQTGVDGCDLKGESGGTVAHLCRLVILTEEPSAFCGSLAVTTGLLGLGKPDDIPTSAMNEAGRAIPPLRRGRRSRVS